VPLLSIQAAAEHGSRLIKQKGKMTREKSRRPVRSPQALRESVARQEAIFASPLVGILTLNESGSIESLNPAAERMFGWRAKALSRRSFDSLVPLGGSDEISLQARLRQLITRDDELRELVGHRRDGSTFPIDFALAEMPLGKRRMFVVFVRDISKRKRSERLKDEFVATVSHELRTPLTSINGSLGLLIGGAAGEVAPAAARLLEIAYNNSQRLVRLINDILDIEKIESGKAAFNLQPTDICTLIEQGIEANRGFADSLGVRIRFEPPPQPTSVRADGDRIVQVVTNLLSNAIKFSPSGAEVVIGTATQGTAVRVSVRDHGPGIPETFKSRIFEKFAQADASNAPRKQGTGLGLNIVKQIVDLHGGVVAFEPAPGGGTVFYFELPWVAEPAISGEAVPRASGVRPRILHVDDDRDVLHVVAETLRADAEIVPAGSLKEARRIIAGGNIDLAVIDLALADGDGLDLLADLRKMDGKAVPVVVFSGHDAGPDVAGRVDAVLTKSRTSLDRLRGILRRMSSAPTVAATSREVA
jgi:PAS domain S-box-containing protein